MNKLVPGIAVVVAAVSVGLLGGCRAGDKREPSAMPVVVGGGGGGATGTGSQTVVARIAGRSITEEQLRKPLVEAYGLNLLVNLVELELANREAARAGVVVTDADVAAERQSTIDRAFAQSNVQRLDAVEQARATDPAKADAMLAELRKDNESALGQHLAQQGASRPQFEIVIRTNAALRKIAEPQVEAALTDERLTESFRIQYGEKVLVRHVQTNSLTDMNAVRRRLAAGEAFEKVAVEMSTNNVTGPLGGEVQPFTRNNEAFPQTFRDAAFALKPGEVSEVVSAAGAFHLIKLEQRIDPKAVKFEDVKEALRVDLRERLLLTAVRDARQQIKREALTGLTIEDPVLKKQFNEQIEKEQAQLRDRDEVREELNRQRQAVEAQQATEAAAATRPTTTPTPGKTSGPTSGPSSGPTSGPATTVVVPASPAQPPSPATVPTPASAPATSPSGTPSSFVDDVLPSTMPRSLKSALPDEATSPSPGAPATQASPAR